MAVSIVGINIKRIRIAKGFSAYKLAKIANVAQSTISQIEGGNRQSLNSETLNKIADALQVTPNELLSMENDTEYTINDIEQAIEIILTSEELVLDDIELTEEEKSLLVKNIKITFDAIRKNREITSNL